MTAQSGAPARGSAQSQNAGYVDGRNADGQSLSGWVSARPDGTAPIIQVKMFGSGLPHSLTIGTARPDVTARFGAGNFRFRIDLPAPPHRGALVSGDLTITSDEIPLKLGASLRATETEAAIAWFRQFAAGELRDVAQQSTGLALPPRPERAEQVSRIPLPVGTKSRDESAIIGTHGNLFIYGGSNALWKRYGAAAGSIDFARTEDEISQWVELLERRAETLRDRGVPFAQTIVPEKSTSIPSGIPQFSGATRALAGIEKAIASQPWYVSGRQCIPAGDEPSSWLKLDSHLSPAGAFWLSNSLIEAVAKGAQIPSFEFSAEESLEGDLTERFFGQIVAEVVASPKSHSLDFLGSSAQLAHSSSADRGGRFVGLKRVWQNASAPLKLRSVVFGNSFFGSNPRTASRCNYWFLRMFEEHHFVWSPEIDYDYLDEVRPDIVVCQTNERFLSTVPGR